MLRHAVLPLAIAYLVFAFVLIAGERTSRGARGRRGRRPRPLRTVVVHVVSLALGGYAALGSVLARYCLGQTRPAACLAPALWETGVLTVAAAVPGLLAMEAASRLRR